MEAREDNSNEPPRIVYKQYVGYGRVEEVEPGESNVLGMRTALGDDLSSECSLFSGDIELG